MKQAVKIILGNHIVTDIKTGQRMVIFNEISNKYI